MADKTEAKLPQVNEKVSELADKVQDQVAKAAGSKENIDNSLYESTLPEGVTVELDNKVREHRQNFHHATALAYGRAMVPAFEKDKKLAEGSISIGMGGKDVIEHHIKRQEDFVNRMDKDNPQTVTKYGHMTTKLSISGTSGTSGQLAAVRKTIGALAAEKLAK